MPKPQLPATPAPDHDPDAYLVRQVRGGDPRAWQQLIDRYHGRLLAFARSRIADAAEAEDVLQETLMGFLSSIKTFDEERSLETYLYAILRYKIQESLTRRRRAPLAPSGFDADDDTPLPNEPADRETPSSVASRREAVRQARSVIAGVLRRLIEELRDRDKLDDLQAVELLFYVGLRNKEAADRLGRDEKSVAGVKFRALNRLREFLADAIAEGQFDPSSVPVQELLTDDAGVAAIWRRYRLTCLKRGTIGSYLLGVLDEPWQGYTKFHLETVACLMCRANRDDLSAGDAGLSRRELPEQLFQSSVGFLSRPASGDSQP